MEQKRLQNTHYQIFGYKGNPAYEDVGEKATHKMLGYTKKEALGAVRIMMDELDCEHVAVFRMDGCIKR